MGIDWDYWIESHFKISTALPMGTAGRLLLGTPDAIVSRPGQYKGIIDLLQTVGDVKVLSSPRIMALNNQEAKIHVGTKDAYITSSTSQAGVGTSVTAQSVNFVDTGIQLSVTPTINKDGFVTMRIKPEVSTATRTNITSEGQITQIPIVTTSEAETTIMIKDGVTVIIGGLKKEEKTRTVNKVPWIGDIPYIGALFRSISDEVKTSDLIILLTPHILTGENSYSSFSEIKPQDGVVARLENGEVVMDKTGKINKPLAAAKPEINAKSQYYKKVTDRLFALAAFQKAQGEQGEVEVSFVLSPDGGLKYEPKVMTSSNQKLNDLAIKAVQSAAPFPAFPPDMPQEEQNFRVSLVYK
ncbi:MAG: TonB family protein [Candidatus Omnitrophica bacterium]|nr:TonB family protein [Candidatus Omnitrophota bacterium]